MQMLVQLYTVVLTVFVTLRYTPGVCWYLRPMQTKTARTFLVCSKRPTPMHKTA